MTPRSMAENARNVHRSARRAALLEPVFECQPSNGFVDGRPPNPGNGVSMSLPPERLMSESVSTRRSSVVTLSSLPGSRSVVARPGQATPEPGVHQQGNTPHPRITRRCLIWRRQGAPDSMRRLSRLVPARVDVR